MLQRDEDAMLEAARQARENAWAPYSGFRVGAAVLGASGRIYPGCNVENASYPVTTCAERNAIGAAISAGERRIVAVMVCADHKDPVTPCGMCRQAIAEFGPDVRVVCVGGGDDRVEYSVSELLPFAFGADKLEGRA
ncbi:MAG TPA: cytidine deaminase [Myxococcota bacterium]|nr:cytidine deaminase [Myxococcota bacterium]HPV03146.1 cytidine deaminase [Myxococcota bacterium]